MRFSLRGHRWVLAAPLLLLAPACGGGDKPAGGDAGDTAAAVTPAPPPPAPAPAADTLTDGDIVAILAASGRSEIVPSQAVKGRLADTTVAKFADSMVTQHTALGDTVTMVARQNNITPTPNAVSAHLDSTTQATVQRLQGLSGAALDSAFAQYMVTSHLEADSAVSNKLIHAAHNTQLHTALQQNVLPMVQAHLKCARKLLSSSPCTP